MYGCDPQWWAHHQGTDFRGEKWSTHDSTRDSVNDKTEAHEKWGVRCVRGARDSTFSTDPSIINYGDNSGFQAVNLAILFGCKHITLIGFDMREVGGKKHFFGDHPQGLGNSANYSNFARHFENAAKHMPKGVRIVNATPNSGLRCFPMMTFDAAMQERYVHDSTHEGLPGKRGVSVPRALSSAGPA